MAEGKDIARKVQAVQGLLGQKLGVRERTLARSVRKAGRRLPRKVRKAARLLIKADGLGGHPKLVRIIDPKALDAAYETISTHLKAIDLADERRGRVLSMLGVIVFNLLLVITAFVVWLWWRGHI